MLLSLAILGNPLEGHAEVNDSLDQRPGAKALAAGPTISNPSGKIYRALERKDLKRARRLVESVELNTLSRYKSGNQGDPSAPQRAETAMKNCSARQKPVHIKARSGIPYGAYSLTTNERISRSTFESLDHLSTLFTQGLGAGVSLLNTDIFRGGEEEPYSFRNHRHGVCPLRCLYPQR